MGEGRLTVSYVDRILDEATILESIAAHTHDGDDGLSITIVAKRLRRLAAEMGDEVVFTPRVVRGPWPMMPRGVRRDR